MIAEYQRGESINIREKSAENQPLKQSSIVKKNWLLHIRHMDISDQKYFSPTSPIVKNNFSLVSSEQNDLIDQTILVTHFQSKHIFFLFRSGPF